MKWLNWLSEKLSNGGVSFTVKTCEEHKKELEQWKADFNKAIEIGNKLKEEIEKLNKELQELNKKPLIEDSEYWNNKWQKSNVFYSAPKRKLITEYVKYREIKEITEIAKELSKQKTNIDDIPKVVLNWLHNKFKLNEFKYVSDTSEKWNTPEETLNSKKGDCDDWGILEYYIIRECFKQLGKWEQVKHRLKCVAGNVNNKGSIPSSAGGHFYLIWLADDCNWYTIESTYFREIALINYKETPQKLNSMYGTIWFSLSEEFSFAQNSIAVSKEDFKKINGGK